MGPRVPPNTIGVFWGYKFPANGPSGSAEHNRGVLVYISPANGPSGSAEHDWAVFGLQIPRQWALGFCRKQSYCFGVTNPPPMGPQVPPNTIRAVFELQIP
ncbi:Hypothetical protein FKW44_005034 [Caligus rogercresseyi]|uniref:Uncharacterized protein n=1 Tax=Caligus rogercresseyi TaxID=217165 RepID=A0A7T8HNH9_CALRO|nr:Hypothetical protein FKW44_005034 [Caligus rogercresseyi]